MQGIFTSSNKNDKNDELSVNDSNYLDNNKLFVSDSNYSHNNKLLVDDDHTFDYDGNVRMSNDTKTLNTTCNNNLIPPDLSTIS